MFKQKTKILRELFIFALPIMVGQLSQMLVGAGDVFVAGSYSTQTLAAIGIANGISSPVFLVGLGLLLGISPILSKKIGQAQSVTEYFHTCILYSLVIGAVFMSITSFITVHIVDYLGFEESLIPLIKEYLFIVGFSYFGSYIFISIREYLQACENVVLANTISVISVFANIALNYVLVFGLLGMPELGIKGLAYSTIIIRLLMAVTIFIYAKKYNKEHFRIRKDFAKHVFKFSLPISMSIFTEILAFSIIMILVGRIGAIQAGIHSIALTLSSITFMVPLAVSSAVAVKIASAYGRNNFDKIKMFIRSSLFISISFMLLAGIIMLLIPSYIIRIFTPDINIIKIGVPIILVCASFQIFDGIQVTLSGILRGLGITKQPFIIVTIGYWLIGLPLGYYLAYIGNLKTLGFWIGLAVTLLFISITLLIYVSRVQKKLFNSHNTL